MTEDDLHAFERLVHSLNGRLDVDAQGTGRDILAATTFLFGQALTVTSTHEALALMNAATVMIDAGSTCDELSYLEVGELWMTRVIQSELITDSSQLVACRYNHANSQISIADRNYDAAWRAAAPGDRSHACADARLTDREKLLSARRSYSDVAQLSTSPRQQSVALVNLANTLDRSGRWIEAYDAYARALDVDAANGAASGNAAILVEQAMRSGWDFEGHLCSLFDHFVAMAHRDRDVTVQVAGEAAARRFDALKPVGGTVPPFSAPNSHDPYLSWVIEHRLALVAALEGIGSGKHSGRWDTLSLNRVGAPPGDHSVPRVHALMNVLKADFIVARRLAYEVDRSLEGNGGWRQDETDPGAYIETLDYAIYGEVSSKLVLAHRAALDVMDKTAVTVNEHLHLGDNPRNINFRKFWFADKRRDRLRQDLEALPGLPIVTLAMAEIALDMGDGGIYERAQGVRNAGTHRFVIVHHGMRDVTATQATTTLTLSEMRQTCHQALTSARAALLYLKSLIDLYEQGKAGGEGPQLLMPLHLSL